MRLYELTENASAGATSSGAIATVATPQGKTQRRSGVYGVEETTNVTDYNPKSPGGTRKECLARLAKTKSKEDTHLARLAGASQKEMRDALDK